MISQQIRFSFSCDVSWKVIKSDFIHLFTQRLNQVSICNTLLTIGLQLMLEAISSHFYHCEQNY